MQHLFVSHDMTVAAREKGFNEPCFAYYSLSGELVTVDVNRERTKYKEDTEAPLYQQLVDWLFEKHDIDISVMGKLPFTYYDDTATDGQLEWHYEYRIIKRKDSQKV